jgi:hypothetical protein
MSILYHPEILSKFRIENMASAMSKSRRVERSTNIPRDASQLLQVLLSEITSPADPQKLFNQLQFGPDSATELTRFLKAKDRAHRLLCHNQIGNDTRRSPAACRLLSCCRI